MKSIAKVTELIKLKIKANTAYSAFMWSYLVVGVIQVVVFYFIWKAVYGEKSIINGDTISQMITYIILSRILISQISWGINIFMSVQIRDGSIAMELLKPFDYQLYIYLIRMGDLACFFILNGLPAFIFSVVAFGITLPKSPTAFLLFLLSMFMGITISFFIEFFVGILTFYSKNGWGMQYTKMAVLDFFSGAMVPLVFLPGWLKDVVGFLPIKDIIYTPVAIYLGTISDEQAIKAILIQVLWSVVLFVAVRAFYNVALKKITVQGG